jgi:hypothetical protein
VLQRYPEYVPFRLTALLSVIILTATTTGCAAKALRNDPLADEAEPAAKLETKASPIVGTWRWSGSGGKIGHIALGEEQFVFRDDGTYAVASKSADGWSECYEGTFTWSAAEEPGHATIVFKAATLREQAGFEREVYLDGEELHFGVGGTYRRTALVVDLQCP